MPTKKPVFVFIPGAWHGAWAYDLVATRLSSAGYRSVLVDLPSSQPAAETQPPLDSRNPDIDIVFKALAETLHSDDDVIVVGHSFGGFVMSEAVGKFLTNRKPDAHMGTCQILWLIYLSAHVPLEGEAPFESLVQIYSNLGMELPQSVPYFDIDGGYLVANEEVGKYFMNDISEPDRMEWIKRLGKQSSKTFQVKSEVEKMGWRSIPSTYIVLEQDRAIVAPIQEGSINRAIQDANARKADMIPFSDPDVGRLYIDSAHDCMLSQPAIVTEYLLKVAAKAMPSHARS